jgi:hypothetical protein
VGHVDLESAQMERSSSFPGQHGGNDEALFCRTTRPVFRISQTVTSHLSTTPTSITHPRTGHGSHGEHPQQPVFSVERSSRRTTNTQWPLWRWANYLQRGWSWSWNAAYACGYLVPWCSPLSVRALVCNQPFYADLELSQVRNKS